MSFNDELRALSGLTAVERRARYGHASAMADPEPGRSGDIPAVPAQGSPPTGINELIRSAAGAAPPAPPPRGPDDPGWTMAHSVHAFFTAATPGQPGDSGGGYRGTSAAFVPEPTFDDVIRQEVRYMRGREPSRYGY
jgi:hypothetical protein